MIALALWVLSNWHLLYQARGIRRDYTARLEEAKAEIRAARAGINVDVRAALSGERFPEDRGREIVRSETNVLTEKIDARLAEGVQIDLGALGAAVGDAVSVRLGKLEEAARARAGKAISIFAKEQGLDVEAMEGALAENDPRAYLAAAYQELATYELGKGFEKEHPVAALAFKAGKPLVMRGIGQMLGLSAGAGQEGAARSLPSGTVASPYGR